MSRSFAVVIATGLISLAACNPAQDSTAGAAPVPPAETPTALVTTSTPTQASAIPAEVRSVVLAARPTMTITEATLKEREGRRYYDVEGTLADGAEIELDLLDGPGGWKVVEIQRDIPWTQTPTSVKVTADAARKGVSPVRVIESVQAESGDVIYELFLEGQPATPALEVMVKDGKASVLKEVWPH